MDCGILGGSTHRSQFYQGAPSRLVSVDDLFHLDIELLQKSTQVKEYVYQSLHSARALMCLSLTLAAFAVVQSMWVDAVRSGGRVFEIDDHRVSLLGHQHWAQVAQPVGFDHLCSVGGVTVLFVNCLLVGGADSLRALFQKDCSISNLKKKITLEDFLILFYSFIICQLFFLICGLC